MSGNEALEDSVTDCLTAQSGSVLPSPTVASGHDSHRQFFVELIKPSHYDDDGYVIQWLKSWMPSNSLACVSGKPGMPCVK